MFGLKPITVAIVGLIGLGGGAIIAFLGESGDRSSGLQDSAPKQVTETRPYTQETGETASGQSDDEELEYVEELPNDEIEQIALQLIDEIASHPQDSDKPDDVTGVSDDELIATDLETIEELMQLALPYARTNDDQPRYLFALGRAALLQGDEELADELLTQAADLGSAGAMAYLAFLTDDLYEIEEYLTAAADSGFEPAWEWLQETRQAIQAAVPPPPDFDFDSYNLPHAIRAFHSGDTEPLNQNALFHYAYATSMNSTLSDISILWVTEESMMLEPDPTLNIDSQIKLMTSEQLLNESIELWTTTGMKMLTAITETRRQGGTPMDEFRAMFTAISGSEGVSLLQVKEMGVQDARRLAILYKTNKEDFRTIYKGLKKFILELR